MRALNKKTIGTTSAAMAALCLVPAAAFAQAAAPAQPEPPADATASSASPSGDVIVTASKREQRLRDVPSAITVLSGARLDTLGVQSVRDYATLTPGLAERDQAYPGLGTVFIRGLSTGFGQQSATTVFYLDDVPFTASSPLNGGAFIAPAPELADIDRIEVLKGPQSTLYGASSLGGVIRLISKRPDATGFSGNARAEMTAIDGGGTGYSLRGSVNVPLVTDRLAVRVTGFYRLAPGFVDNLGTGTTNVNRSIMKGGRVAIGWKPTDRLTVDVVGQIQDINTRGPATQSQGGSTLVPNLGERKYSEFFDAPTLVRYRLASVAVNYDTGLGHVIATASYLKSRLFNMADVTTSFAPYLPLFGYPAGTGVDTESNIPLTKKTAEVRFVSNRLGPVEFIIGGFYTDETAFVPTPIVARDAATNVVLPAPYGNFSYANIDDTYKEAAVFGNATFYLTSKLDITGGARFAHNKEDNAIFLGGFLYGGVDLPPQKSNFSDNVGTYLATLRWRPTSSLSVFLRAASGYRPGVPQTNPSPPPGAQTRISPDTVWNYEAGVKGDLLDHKLSFEASVYHIDWSHIQLTTSYNNVTLLANAGKAQVDGAELQAVARPTRNLTIGGNLAYTNARITSVEPGVTATVGAAKGDPMPATSRWTSSATVDQLVPLGSVVDGQIGATLRYQSPTFNSFPASPSYPNVKLPAITTVDLRAGVRFRRYQLQFRVENVFDRNGIINIRTSPGIPGTATITRPRSFTLSASTDF